MLSNNVLNTQCPQYQTHHKIQLKDRRNSHRNVQVYLVDQSPNTFVNIKWHSLFVKAHPRAEVKTVHIKGVFGVASHKCFHRF